MAWNKIRGDCVFSGRYIIVPLRQAAYNQYTLMKVSDEHMATHANLFYVGDQDFESKVLKSDTPVIVDFWAEWCGPCRAIAPVYEKLSDEYNGKLSFAKMDIDENQFTPGRLGIQAIPTMMVFKGGKPVARLVGPHPMRLKNEIDRVLAENGVA